MPGRNGFPALLWRRRSESWLVEVGTGVCKSRGGSLVLQYPWCCLKENSTHHHRAPNNFESNGYLLPKLSLNVDIKIASGIFTPYIFLAMLKREGSTILKQVYTVLCHFKYGFGSDLLLLVV